MIRGYRNYHITRRLLVVILLTATLILPVCACGMTPVTFPDLSIEAAVREALDKPEGVISRYALSAITELWISESGIQDLTGLEHCVNLERLGLDGNNISDISALARLSNLEYLNLGKTSASDISSLADLTNLQKLYLNDNNISDISSLVENSGLSAGDTVNLGGNPLNTTSMNDYIPQLEARGVNVEN